MAQFPFLRKISFQFVCLCYLLRFDWLYGRTKTWPNLWLRVFYSVNFPLPQPPLLPPWGRCHPSLSGPPQTRALPCFRVSPSPRRCCTQPRDPSVQHTRQFCFLPTEPARTSQSSSELQQRSRAEIRTRCDTRQRSLRSTCRQTQWVSRTRTEDCLLGPAL